MATHSPAMRPPMTLATANPTEVQKRQWRWRFFQAIFFLTYVGIVLDIVTTAMGYQRAGSAYEQNPLGGQLIGGLGWVGLLFLMMALCAVLYWSMRIVYWRMSLRWSAILNSVLSIVMIVRWLTVAAAIVYLIQPS